MRSFISTTRSGLLAITTAVLSASRAPLALGVFGVLVTGGMTGASAEELQALPIPPTVDARAQAPASSTTTVITTTQAAPAAPAALPLPPLYPAAPAQAAAPAGVPRGAIYYNGPVWVIPAQGAPVEQALPPPPLYTAPPPLWAVPPRLSPCCSSMVTPFVPPRGPVFSIGLRFTTMGISQKVFGNDLNLIGGGVQLRFRTRGHWGFETAFDVLEGSVNNGAFQRNSYPFTASVMLYLFRNRPENHFNIYGIAGVGLSADSITLYNGTSEQRNQQFLELLGEAGGGVELRFHRLALSADIRAIGLTLDQSSPGGSYYTSVDGGPIPNSSIGYKANFGALIWF